MYIQRERERERDVCVYIYIYIYTYLGSPYGEVRAAIAAAYQYFCHCAMTLFGCVAPASGCAALRRAAVLVRRQAERISLAKRAPLARLGPGLAWPDLLAACPGRTILVAISITTIATILTTITIITTIITTVTTITTITSTTIITTLPCPAPPRPAPPRLHGWLPTRLRRSSHTGSVGAEKGKARKVSLSN